MANIGNWKFEKQNNNNYNCNSKYRKLQKNHGNY